MIKPEDCPHLELYGGRCTGCGTQIEVWDDSIPTPEERVAAARQRAMASVDHDAFIEALERELVAEIRAAVEAEREACALLVERWTVLDYCPRVSTNIVAGIRNRTKEDKT